MKAIICQAPGQLQLIDKSDSVEPKPGEIRISVKRVGICGTDFHIYSGKHPYLVYPRIIGHELSGVVADKNETSNFSVNQKVLINPYLACGECAACRKQKPNCCMNLEVLGVHTDGGMREHINVRESQVYSAEGLTLDEAAMIEFLAIGAHGVRRGDVQYGDQVLVVGAGPIGLGAALFAKVTGAHVSVLDIDVNRVDSAVSILGNVTGYTAHDRIEEELHAATQKNWFDVVLDATGNAKSMENSIRYTGHGGTCVFISIVKEDIRFHDPLFHSRELKLVASRNATTEDFEQVIEHVKNGRVPTDKLLTHRAEIEDAAQRITEWALDKAGLIKAVISI